MKNKTSGIFIFENPKEFLKALDELQEQYNLKYNSSSDEDGVELDDY